MSTQVNQQSLSLQLEQIRVQLERSEQRYRNLYNNVPLGIYRRTPGPEGKLVMVNPALVDMFGYDSAEELNQVPVTRIYYFPEQCKAFSNKLFTHKEVIWEQLKMKRKDGSGFWISVSTRVICDEENNPLYFDGIMEDITEKRRMEKAARMQQRQLLQADKMISLGILVSGVAHEINNPNQFVVSHLAPLRRAFADALPILDRYAAENGDFRLGGISYKKMRERIPSMFENIHEGTSRIAHIVNELRDYAREHPSEMTEQVDLNQVVRSALSLTMNLTKKSTTAFYVNYGKSLPPFVGDYRKIEQVVINLVQNACQSFEREPGEISITTAFDEATGELMFQIDDTGCGIAKADLSRIRDPFFTTKRARGGTGLGMAISHNIVDAHGGRLVVTSEEGEGTTVKVFLPVVGKDAITHKDRKGDQ